MLTIVRRTLSAAVTVALFSPHAALCQESPLRRIAPDPSTKTSSAVVVSGSTPLVHTSQILPRDERGAIISPGRAEGQAVALIEQLERALRESGSGIDRLVKVDVYATKPDAIASFQTELARRITLATAPAISYMVGALAERGALLALDAVAATDLASRGATVLRLDVPTPAGQRNGGKLAVLPAGCRVFISGQADPASDLAQATRRTLEGLDRTLTHLDLDRTRVVRLKAFLNPMASAADVEREIRTFFGASPLPPVTLVEWRSPVPIEIELITAGGSPRPGAEPIEYLAAPGLKPSPVFSRVARVNGGDLIYTSSLYGPASGTAAQQVEEIFAALGRLMNEAGSDFRHLVKATYYVSDDEASRALNELRPRYYDAARPPAASKATVSGVGLVGRTVALDIIAAVAKP
jgi:enamine deaminase RidA (YjgF/YER057c/UK114 family)